MLDREILRMVVGVAAVLDGLAIPYLVGGSVASGLFGEPRGTRGIDLVVDLPSSAVEPLAAALESNFYVSREAMREAVRDRRSFNAVELEGGMKVDFFVRGDSGCWPCGPANSTRLTSTRGQCDSA